MISPPTRFRRRYAAAILPMCDTGNETTSGSDRSPAPFSRVDSECALIARITDREDGISECTLYPRSAAGVDLMSSWITAEEDGYVCLDEMR